MRAHKIIAILVSLLLSLVIAEAALRLLEKFRLGDRAIEGKLINHPILGQKLHERIAEAVMDGKTGPDPTYGKLIEMEGRVRTEIEDECQTQSIDYPDALPYL